MKPITLDMDQVKEWLLSRATMHQNRFEWEASFEDLYLLTTINRGGFDIPAAATVDGEPVPVERMPGPGKCSRCGRHDPLTAAYREKYDVAYKQAGKTLPEGVCEECAMELWRA